MAKEDKFADEVMSDAELDQVAGGFYARSNGGEVEKDQEVKIENQSRVIHVTATALATASVLPL